MNREDAAREIGMKVLRKYDEALPGIEVYGLTDPDLMPYDDKRLNEIAEEFEPFWPEIAR